MLATDPRNCEGHPCGWWLGRGSTGSRHARRSGASKSVSAPESDYIRPNYIRLGTQLRAGPCSMEPGWCCQCLARHESESPEIPYSQARNCNWTRPVAAAVGAANGPVNSAPTVCRLG